LVGYPIIYRVFYICGGAGFLPSTVVGKKTEEMIDCFLLSKLPEKKAT